MPITLPNAWNQNGSLNRERNSAGSVVEEDALGDGGAEQRHPLRQPGRHAASVQRQVRES